MSDATPTGPEDERSVVHRLAGKARDAVGSKHFSTAKERAAALLDNVPRISDLLDRATAKSQKDELGRVEEMLEQLKALIRMVRAYVKGSYREISKENIVLAVAGIMYFVSPLDLIPDMLGVVGLSDDALVIAFVLDRINDELFKFLAWEEALEASSDAAEVAGADVADSLTD